MAVNRLKREEFFDKLVELDRAELKNMLWTVYWRGSAQMRERIEAVIDPQLHEGRTAKARPDSAAVLENVTQFAKLAREGAYLAGDRRVSAKERTRWRHTFRGHAAEAMEALAGDDVLTAARALAALIDLACETQEYEYFRSEDPVEAARFVVSDAAAALWTAIRDEYGFSRFSQLAAGQLLRWESRYGWTRRGYGWVSERETSLAQVIAGLLPTTDGWGQFADQYLLALDRAAEVGGSREGGGAPGWQRAEALSEWHALLLFRLVDGDYDDRLDVLVEHPALGGPERTFLQARLAEHRGDRDAARRLVRECLAALPGHREFLAFEAQLGA